MRTPRTTPMTTATTKPATYKESFIRLYTETGSYSRAAWTQNLFFACQKQ